MSRREQHPGQELLARQRLAAERLRRELLGLDGSLEHSYFHHLERQLGSFRRVASRDELISAAAAADIVYVGDFHALEACQLFAAELLKQLARRTLKLVLGIEFIYTRQQRLLDRRQQGQLDDARFLKRVHYREEWGYPWTGYERVLDTARQLAIPVYALDAPPRGGFQGLRRRDDHAARRILATLQADPGTRMLVLFGESHLAAPHLPRAVHARLKRAGLDRRSLVVLQNADSIYWQLVEQGDADQATVQVDASTWVVLNSSPLEKYEAYRQVLDRWRGDAPHDDEIDLTPAVHHLLAVLCGWIGINPERRQVRHRAGWDEELIDAYPEVYSGQEAAELIESILREQGRNDDEIGAATASLRERGALYDSRSNTLFLQRYLPGPAAGEASRFLRAALTGRLFIAAEDFAEDLAQAAYGAAFTEALVYLGSRLVDPTSSYPGAEVARLAAAGSGGPRPVPQEWMFWLDLHHRFEAHGSGIPPDALMERLRLSRPLRRALAKDLGSRLGRVLFERVRRGELDGKSLRRLFSRPLQPSRAASYVLQLLRG